MCAYVVARVWEAYNSFLDDNLQEIRVRDKIHGYYLEKEENLEQSKRNADKVMEMLKGYEKRDEI